MFRISWCVGWLGLAAVAAGARADTVVVNGRTSADPCLVIAGAKQAQWRQTPLLIRETKFFADNSTRVAETIFTGDSAYGHYLGMPWNTASYQAPEREAKSPELAVKAMRLEHCELVGPAADGGSHLYAFSYLPDRDGTHSTGQIVISDATGLPLQQDISFNAAHPQSDSAAKISATFTYGDAARVPRDAALAEVDERKRQERAVRELQQRSSFSGHY